MFLFGMHCFEKLLYALLLSKLPKTQGQLHLGKKKAVLQINKTASGKT